MSINKNARTLGSSYGRRPRPASLAVSDSVRRRLADLTSSQSNVIVGCTIDDAYNAAIGVVTLAHRLQSRVRAGTVSSGVGAGPGTNPNSSSSTVKKGIASSLPTLIKSHLSVLKESETKLPSSFGKQLEQRMTKVLMGKDPTPGYQDPSLKRTFGAFLNQLRDAHFFQSITKGGRVEDFLLIFISKGTAVLKTGNVDVNVDADILLDKHCSLFLRLIASILKDAGWSSEKSPLIARLKTMETQLYQHDPNIAISSTDDTSQPDPTVSIELKNIPLAQHLRSLLGYETERVQTDIAISPSIWTAPTAMRDLKRYQTLLNLGIRPKGSTVPLCLEDFEHRAGYDAWKRSEVDSVNSLIVSIINHQPDLARSTILAAQGSSPPTISHRPDFDGSGISMTSSPKLLHRMSSPMVESLPVDLEAPFTVLPLSPNTLYRIMLKIALSHEISCRSESAGTVDAAFSLPKLTTDLLHLLATWWRVPSYSRPVLFLDVARELFEDGALNTELLESVFIFIDDLDKCPLMDKKKLHSTANGTASDQSISNKRMSMMQLSAAPMLLPSGELDVRALWMTADVTMWKKCLEVIHNSLLRDLFTLLMKIYDAKPPNISIVMVVLETYIFNDEMCPIQPEALDKFAAEVDVGLREVARTLYDDIREKTLQTYNEDGEEETTFDSVLKFGKAVVRAVERIVKRMRKFPQEAIMGVRPIPALLNVFVPEFVRDCQQAVNQIISRSVEQEKEIDIEDGFQFYQGLSDIRQSLTEADPALMTKRKLEIEGHLRVFVDRWIVLSGSKVPTWIENSVNEDTFSLAQLDYELTDSQRNSHSSNDIFRILRDVVDTVNNLNWDHAVQRAEFMTSFSKIISDAVVNYCQMVERMFTRELHQGRELQRTQTVSQWERYSQIAREAWTVAKMEPYHFREQSLVKLNNIEHILQQLDVEERKMNVDSVLETLARKQPAKPSARRSERYVFTIKIVEAENLKPCDMNGLSDPYVVLGDEFQKRLTKTRVVYNNLNPRWEESVDIVTTGPLNVIATVWDWDALGDHDCVGRTSLKLDPNHFRDYVPREYWLSLDSQGRLLVRVSMEGERDDIEFYFGKAFRTLKRTERDMTRLIAEKLGAYIRHVISTRSLQQLLQRNLTSRFNSLLKKQSMNVSSPTPADVTNVITPLLEYFDANFALINQTLTKSSMMAVMSRLWKEVLLTTEALLVPPLSDEPSSQHQLSQMEVDIVYRWLDIIFNFFHAVDADTNVAQGVPVEILKSSKYHDLKNLAFFYFQPTEDLVQESDRIAAQTAAQAHQSNARSNWARGSKSDEHGNSGLPPSGAENLYSPLSPLSPLSAVLSSQAASSGTRSSSFLSAATSPSPTASLFGIGSVRRHKSVLLSRNLGTMKRAKEQKRKEIQAEPSDDMILRILRMRPDAMRYLKERARQKERLAAVRAAEMIVLRSLAGQTGVYNNEERKSFK